MSTATQPTPTHDVADEPTSADALIERAVAQWQARLDEIEQEAKPLNEEVEKLRKAIRRARPTEPAPSRRSSSRGSQTRETILAALGPDAKTARQVSEETGIPIGTVSSNLRTLTTDGHAVKATKGYQAHS